MKRLTIFFTAMLLVVGLFYSPSAYSGRNYFHTGLDISRDKLSYMKRWQNGSPFDNCYYVNGDSGRDVGVGDINDPFVTIQKAINTAGSQDTIYIRAKAPDADASEPGTYVEDLTIPYAKHGLKLIGIGPSGSGIPFFGPKIKNATATALLTVNASGVHIEGLQFNCTRNSGTYGILLSGHVGYTTLAGSVGATITNCYFKNASATYGAISIEGGYATTISRCTFSLGTNYLGIKFTNAAVPSNGHTVEYCNFKDNNGASVTLYMSISASTEDFNIDHCNFGQATKFITVVDGASGMISNCTFNDGSTAVKASNGEKVDIPTACDEVGVAGCYGGDGTLVDADGA